MLLCVRNVTQNRPISRYRNKWLCFHNRDRVCLLNGTDCIFKRSSGKSWSLNFAGQPSWRPGFDPRSGYVRFVVDKVALVQVLLQVLRFFPCQYYSTNAIYSYWYTLLLLSEWKTGEGRKPFKNALSEIGENWIEKNFYLFFIGLFYTVWSVDIYSETSTDLPLIFE